MSFFPFVAFDSVPLSVANDCLQRWGHRMGPVERPMGELAVHALFHHGEPVAVVTTHTLIRENVGGGLKQLTRDNTLELSRLCAARPDLCRVALRLWREFVFPALGYPVAISYQDADIHTGQVYRFDGWENVAYARAGGNDQRSGRRARNRYVWSYPVRAASLAADWPGLFGPTMRPRAIPRAA